MNLQEQTLQQIGAAVALKPVIQDRFERLMKLLDEASAVDIELWRIDLARNDLIAALDVALPRIVVDEEE